jgi:hypothetical protein
VGGLGHGILRGRVVVGPRGSSQAQDLHPHVAHQTIAQVPPPPHGTRHSNVRHGTRVKALTANTTGEKTLKIQKKSASKIEQSFFLI